MSLCRYIIGDSKNLEAEFKRTKLKQPSLVLTSPPYFDLLNYGNVRSQVGHDQTYESYIDVVADILQQCYRVAATNATLWLVVDTMRQNKVTVPLPFDINEALLRRFGDTTWLLRDIIIWNKGKNIPWHAKGRFKNQFEYVLFFSKNDDFKFKIDKSREIVNDKKWWLTYPERYNPNGSAPSNIWEFTIPIRGWGKGRQNHLCPFPFPLVERILSLCTDEGDLVVDPFAGSGSTLAVAKLMKRDSVGFDVNKRYKKLFQREVLKGATLYWHKRRSELREWGKHARSFKKTNVGLRRIKASLSFLNHINWPSTIIPVLLANAENSTAVDLLIIANKTKTLQTRIDLTSKTLKGLNSEFKVRLNVRCVLSKDSKRILRGVRSLYSYSPDRIYEYSKRITVSDFQSGEGCDKAVLYSNLKLDLADFNNANGNHQRNGVSRAKKSTIADSGLAL
jgi:DNA modification methylase